MAGVDWWTVADSRAAISQGWDLFENNSGLQLQFCQDDLANSLKSDDEAFLHVFDRSDAGDPVCIKALKVLRREAPNEFALIARYVGIQRGRQIAA